MSLKIAIDITYKGCASSWSETTFFCRLKSKAFSTLGVKGGGVVVEHRTKNRDALGSISWGTVLCPRARHKCLLRPDMTENMLMGTLNIKTNKQTNKTNKNDFFSKKYIMLLRIF